MKIESQIKTRLNKIYKDETKEKEAYNLITKLLENYTFIGKKDVKYSEKDVMLITYGDTINKSGEASLKTLNTFLNDKVKDAISSVHILPMYPYTSDDGFSVVDYLEINKDLGDWNDIKALSENYTLMFDAVVNHISKSSEWFKKYLDCEEGYEDYFITADENLDYSKVTRPRALPLLTKFETKDGVKSVWTTFSEDQIDLNFANPKVLVEVLNVLLTYAEKGAKYIRLDAIGFIWKELGTSCIHLDEAHEIIKLYREILDNYTNGVILITETNVPHKDNISYFGNGHDEAHMVYQFALPPLVMFSIQSKNTNKLSNWLNQLSYPSNETTFFNFLSSHDGIGVRSTNGILNDEERGLLERKTLENGGEVSYAYNSDGTQSPYELNINYFDAIIDKDDNDMTRIKKFLMAETILLSLKGVPAIYIHSLLGSRNDYYGKTTSQIKRRINREKLDIDYINNMLENDDNNRKIIFDELIRRLNIRKENNCFSPNATQEVLFFNESLLSFKRISNEDNTEMLILANVSDKNVDIDLLDFEGEDLLTGTKISHKLRVRPFQTLWILKKQ